MSGAVCACGADIKQPLVGVAPRGRQLLFFDVLGKGRQEDQGRAVVSGTSTVMCFPLLWESLAFKQGYLQLENKAGSGVVKCINVLHSEQRVLLIVSTRKPRLATK